MQISIHEHWIAGRLKGFFREKGFDWLPHLHQFRRSTERGFTCVILSVSDYDELSLVEAHLGIRIDDVENLVFPFTNGLPGFKPDSMTLVTPLSRLKGKAFERFEVVDENTAAKTVDAFMSQLAPRGIAFLERYNELERMEALFNDTPDSTLELVHNQINRCFRGAVLARLLQRKDFEFLVEIYGRKLENSLNAPQPTIDKFYRLCNFLRNYSQN